MRVRSYVNVELGVGVFPCLTWYFFFSSRRRHTRSDRDWSSDVCSSDLPLARDRLRRTLSGTACPWSPDFPLRSTFRHWTRAAVRPTDQAGVGWGGPRVKEIGRASCRERG